MDDTKIIKAHIERAVTHIAREHGATDDVVWKLMLIAASENVSKQW
ncbi:MAG: hypothetical protein K6E67_10315 [Prevotella sp.]|nr:hypothetical protein [Prevotella sp.]